MTPCEQRGWKVGDRFRVVRQEMAGYRQNRGDVITLLEDDGSVAPFFRNETRKRNHCAIYLDAIEPITPNWTGPADGLPPAGAECEYCLGDSENWFPCKIKAICANQGAIIECDVDYGEQYVCLYGSQAVKFRPLKSDRERAIDEMAQVIDGPTLDGGKYLRELATKLYEAGYRKTEAES